MLLVACNNDSEEAEEPLAYEEAQQVQSIVMERYIELEEKENKNPEEVKLANNVISFGIDGDNKINVYLLNNTDEIIGLFKKYVLEDVEKAEYVIFKKGVTEEPAS
jgi:hypothetical protein